MKTGKVPESVLKRSVLQQIHNRREEVILGAGVGEDCAILALPEDEVFVVSTDPITGTARDAGMLAVQVSANDLASAGAEPVAVLVSALLPEGTEEAEIREYVNTGDPLDKAGAYGIQGFCARYISGIEGDYNNVVGLPVGILYQKIKELVQHEKSSNI